MAASFSWIFACLAASFSASLAAFAASFAAAFAAAFATFAGGKPPACPPPSAREEDGVDTGLPAECSGTSTPASTFTNTSGINTSARDNSTLLLTFSTCIFTYYFITTLLLYYCPRDYTLTHIQFILRPGREQRNTSRKCTTIYFRVFHINIYFFQT